MTDEERPERRAWPPRDLPTPATEAGRPTTSGGWDPEQGERRQPTTAEQAVPWLIGLILALSGIMVVLLALIFTGPDSLTVGLATPTPLPSPTTSEAVPTATPLPTASPIPTPIPTFAPLEMVFLAKSKTDAPFDLMRRDFAQKPDTAILVADGTAGGLAFAWSPDGLQGAAIIGGNAWHVTAGDEPISLLLNVSAIVFSDDSTTLYALRITQDGADDHADLYAINVLTAAAQKIAGVTYPHPRTSAANPIHQAQFNDDGGASRLYFTVDGYVVIQVKGAPSIYRVDPVTGAVTTAQHAPTLWSPDQELRVEVSERNSSLTRLILHNADGSVVATADAVGLVSHVRWAPTSNEIVFTVSHYSTGTTVLTDLWVWDLVPGHKATPLTSNGLARGAEWLSAAQVWLP